MIKIAIYLDLNIRKVIKEQLSLIRENIEKSTLLSEIYNAKSKTEKLEKIKEFKGKNYKGADYWIDAVENNTLKKAISSLNQMYDVQFKKLSDLLVAYPRFVSNSDSNEIKRMKEVVEKLKKQL